MQGLPSHPLVERPHLRLQQRHLQRNLPRGSKGNGPPRAENAGISPVESLSASTTRWHKTSATVDLTGQYAMGRGGGSFDHYYMQRIGSSQYPPECGNGVAR